MIDYITKRLDLYKPKVFLKKSLQLFNDRNLRLQPHKLLLHAQGIVGYTITESIRSVSHKG